MDTATGFTAARQKYNPPEGSPYRWVCEKSVAGMERSERSGRPPESVARVALKLAGRRNPPVRVAVGLEYKALMLLRRIMPDRLAEWVLGKLYL